MIGIWLCCCCWMCCLLGVLGSWIDPDTPLENRQIIPLSKSKPKPHNNNNNNNSNQAYKLVFSDEFNIDGRSFQDGSDPRWTAINKDDYTNYALHYYNENLAMTSNGKLNISTILHDITFSIESKATATATTTVSSTKTTKMTKNFQSGMIQGWNKFCFTGGIIEISAQLPGKWDVGGLWPAMWLLGNLARATYVGSSNNMWPWSYDECNRPLQHQQEISACKRVNYYGMHPFQGRGAPEIDILEAMSGNEVLLNTKIHKPYFSSSLQVSPAYLNTTRPETGSVPLPGTWYDRGIEYGGILHNNNNNNVSNYNVSSDNSNSSVVETDLNIFFYGVHLEGVTADRSYIGDALSANTNLFAKHFEQQHLYRLEWIPGKHGYLKWYLDNKFLYGIDASAFENKTNALIPTEPCYLILNTAVSSTWGFPYHNNNDNEGIGENGERCFDPRVDECAANVPNGFAKNFPAEFLIDYVRVYQAVGDETQTIGCSPKKFPTKKFIEGQPERYKSKGDAQVLREVRRGGAACFSNQDCGRGHCNNNNNNGKKGKCVCEANFTGPTCRAAIGFNDNNDEEETTIFTLIAWFAVPLPLLLLMLSLLVLLVVVVVWRYREHRKERQQQQPLLNHIPFSATTTTTTTTTTVGWEERIAEAFNAMIDWMVSCYYYLRFSSRHRYHQQQQHGRQQWHYTPLHGHDSIDDDDDDDNNNNNNNNIPMTLEMTRTSHFQQQQ